jgi:hypothetical protein
MYTTYPFPELQSESNSHPGFLRDSEYKPKGYAYRISLRENEVLFAPRISLRENEVLFASFASSRGQFQKRNKLTVNQLWETVSTNPKTTHFVPEGEEVMGVFASPAVEAADGDVFFPRLSFCFFFIELDCVSFFDEDGIFRTNIYAVAHTVTVFFGYYFCFSINEFNSAFIAGCDAFPTACAFFSSLFTINRFTMKMTPFKNDINKIPGYWPNGWNLLESDFRK